MAGITTAQATAKLTLWMAADDAVATGQKYKIADRDLTRADANLIKQNIEYWNRIVKKLSRGGMRIRRAVPL